MGINRWIIGLLASLTAVGALADGDDTPQSVASDMPTIVRLKRAPNAFTSGPNGDLYMDSPSPFTTVGVLMQAHSGTPNVTARTGTADSNSYFSVNNSSAEIFRVRGDGRVGVGTSSPGAAFHVNGDALVDSGQAGWLTLGGITTSAESAFVRFRTGSAKYAWVIAAQLNYHNTLEFTPSTAIAGTTFSVPAMVIQQIGNVGIGTPTPATTLETLSTDSATKGITNTYVATDTGGSQLQLQKSRGSIGAYTPIQSGDVLGVMAINGNDATAATANYQAAGYVRTVADETWSTGHHGAHVEFWTTPVGSAATAEVLRITGSSLQVTGGANFTGTVTGGNIAAKYQDVAEWVPAEANLAPGTVVVLDPVHDNRVIASSKPYDVTVAGVVSAQPGIVLGQASASKAQVATTGRVRVRVDASRLPIRRGDLLTTSDMTGVAMRSKPITFAGRSFHQPGTIIGKALEPLADGQGEILVLLSLQ